MLSTHRLTPLPAPDEQGRTYHVDPGLDGLFRFPAGEWSADHEREGFPPESAANMITIRWESPDDFLAAAMIVDENRSRGVETDLFVPYLPGARADRGVPLGSRTYANLINLVGARHVYSVDPHSPVMPGMINGHKSFGLGSFIADAMRHYNQDREYVGVIAPDAGARGRASLAAESMGVPLYQATKRRDFKTGHLSGFEMVDALPEEGRLLVVDDICDGGGTFLGLAEATGLGRDRVDLWVTHGVFSKPDVPLWESYGRVLFTDSLPWDREAPAKAYQVQVEQYLLSRLHLAT